LFFFCFFCFYVMSSPMRTLYVYFYFLGGGGGRGVVQVSC